MIERNAFKKTEILAAVMKSKLEVRTWKSDEDVFLHDGPEWYWEDMMVVKRKGSQFCLIHPDVAMKISKQRLMTCNLHAAASSKGGFSVLPVQVGKFGAEKAAERALGNWSHTEWANKTREYVSSDPSGDHAQPIWPFENFAEMVEAAFGGDHIIDSEDHPLFKEITGQVAA